jgi:hypothetical protein
VSPPAPRVSVVVATRGPLTALAPLLTSLRDQTYPIHDLEVIVAAHGPREDAPPPSFLHELPYALEVIELPGAGAAGARNHGAASARGALLLFLADDLEPAATRVESHVRAHEGGSERAVFGLHSAVRTEASELRQVPRPPDLLQNPVTYRDLNGGNLSLKSEVFERVGGFDPTMPLSFGAVWELGVRLERAGVELHPLPAPAIDIQSPAPPAVEQRGTDVHRLIQRAREEGRVDAQIRRRHPWFTPAWSSPSPGIPPRLGGAFMALDRRWPAAGEWVTALVGDLLRLLEQRHLSSQWRFLYDVLRAYGYWRGTRDEQRLAEARDTVQGTSREDLAGFPDHSVLFAAEVLQMSYGERAALEGLLATSRPALAIEIGTAGGGSLQRLAHHSREVHTFDVKPAPLHQPFDNVTFHTGDSHVLLPRFLRTLTAEGRNVEFVLVDGDHSSEGVRRDVTDLLASDAVRRTTILIHDAMNPGVRQGLEAIPFESHAKVAYVELEFVPAHCLSWDPYRYQFWGGFGLVLVDADRGAPRGGDVRQKGYYEVAELIEPLTRLIVSREEGGRGPR